MKFEIKSRFSGVVLFALETESLKLTVEAAVKSGAYLRDADLGDADLGGADLRGADLGGADLGGADLRGAYLRGAYLRGANLGDADLGGADLRGAYLRDAYLGGAYLGDADLGGADLGDADLGGAYLGGAYLGDAYLGDAKFKSPCGADLLCVGERPILQLGPLGSRADYLLAVLTDHGVYIRAGCFWDTLDKFRAAVVEKHGDSRYSVEYRAAIALIELLWPPFAMGGCMTPADASTFDFRDGQGCAR